MEVNFTFFGNESSSSETNSTKSKIETIHPFLTYLNLIGLSLGVLLVIVPALIVIIIVLKNRKLREKHNNIFYVNLLIVDVVATLSRWIVTSTIIICHLLDVPIVNCSVAHVVISTSLFGSKLMFLPVVIDRLLHIAFPFSYRSIVTAKRIALSIGSLWLMTLVCGILSTVNQNYTLIPEQGVCIPEVRSVPVFLFISGSLAVSVCVITGTCIYLRYKIIHSNRFFKSVKRNAIEEEKAVKVGRLVEILQEQVRPTFSVFLAGGIDAAFNGVGIFHLVLVRIFDLGMFTRYSVVVLLQFGQYFTHAVVYAVRDNKIRREIIAIYKRINGPKESKVIILN